MKAYLEIVNLSADVITASGCTPAQGCTTDTFDANAPCTEGD